MSLEHSRAVWELDISSSLKLVALCFADHANDDGVAWPSVPRVAARTGLTPRFVTKALGILTATGVLELVEVERGVRSRRYRVLTPEHRSPLNEIHPEHRSPLSPARRSGLNAVRGESRSATPEPGSATPEPGSAESIRTTRNDQRGTRTLFLEGFDEFYAAYPRHEARADAERAWSKLRPSAEQRTLILARIKRAVDCGEWQLSCKKFIPLPATFLNGRRWEDEAPESQPATQESEKYPYAGYARRELWECDHCGEAHDRPPAEVHATEAVA